MHVGHKHTAMSECDENCLDVIRDLNHTRISMRAPLRVTLRKHVPLLHSRSGYTNETHYTLKLDAARTDPMRSSCALSNVGEILKMIDTGTPRTTTYFDALFRLSVVRGCGGTHTRRPNFAIYMCVSVCMCFKVHRYIFMKKECICADNTGLPPWTKR